MPKHLMRKTVDPVRDAEEWERAMAIVEPALEKMKPESKKKKKKDPENIPPHKPQPTVSHTAKLKKPYVLLDCLSRTSGIASDAIKLFKKENGRIPIELNDHYVYLKRFEWYAASVALLKEGVLDMAESTLHRLIQNGELTAVQYYLNNQGKSRGYNQKQEVDVKHSGNINHEHTHHIVVDFSDRPD